MITTCSVPRNTVGNSVIVELLNKDTSNPQTGKFARDITCTVSQDKDTFYTLRLVDLDAVKDPWVSGGWDEVDAIRFPGLYRFDIPSAITDDKAASFVLISFACSDVDPFVLQIPISDTQLTRSFWSKLNPFA